MSEFNKKPLQETSKRAMAWWSFSRLPIRIVALCCCVALVVTGAVLLWPTPTDKEVGGSETGSSSSLVNGTTASGEQNNSQQGGVAQNSPTVPLNGTTPSSSNAVNDGTTSNAATLPTIDASNPVMQGDGDWTITTTVTSLPTSQQWSVLQKSVSGSGVVRWKESSDFGRIATAMPQTSNTLGVFGQRLSKRVLVALENGNARAAGLTILLNNASGQPICQSITAENGTAVLAYGNQQPKTLEIKYGDNSLEKLPFNGTVGTVSLSLSLPEITTKPALDLMIVAETAPSTKSTVSTLSSHLSKVANTAAGRVDASVKAAAVCYDSKVSSTPFATGTSKTASFLKNQSFPSSAAKQPTFAAALAEAVSSHAWRHGATKVIVLVVDTVPTLSEKDATTVSKALNEAAAQGIRIVTLAKENCDIDTELLLRAISFGTGGDFLFRAANTANNGTLTAHPIDTVLIDVLTDILKIA